MLFREGNIIHIETTTLPGSEFQPYPVINPFLPMHIGLHPSLLQPPNPEPLPGTIQNASPNNVTVNPCRDTDLQHYPAESPPASNPLENTNSKRLEYLLDSALATALTIQTSGISSSADILSPRAYNTLKALNALVSVEMPVSGSRTDSPRYVTKWLGSVIDKPLPRSSFFFQTSLETVTEQDLSRLASSRTKWLRILHSP